MKFKRNTSASPIFSKQSPARQDNMTTQEKYTQGMDNIVSYIEENPNANKEDIRDLVIKHNRSLEAMNLKSSKNFTNAKIPVSHAWKFLPKDKKVQQVAKPVGKEEVKSNEIYSASNLTQVNKEGDIVSRIIQNPNYNPNFKGPVSELKETQEYIVDRNKEAIEARNDKEYVKEQFLKDQAQAKMKAMRGIPFKKLKFGRKI